MTTHTENLPGLITRARYVLFDFDGPICRLFAGHSAQDVTRVLVGWLEARGLRDLLTDEEQWSTDPWDVLRAVDSRHPRPGALVAALEERLTQEELKAAACAAPTPYADRLLRTWAAQGAGLAVTTNNSPRAARQYLAGRGLESVFGPHLYGRSRDLSLLKPDPHCLDQALRAFGAAPEDALMIGDAPTDLMAARSAGVGFLGYVRNERKEKILRDAGAGYLVPTLQDVLSVLTAG
ncbi:HAD family hydrolase [Streptomyces sp. NPDC089424]|uniref:HAD family hydrolase n=1 Tax=Streptomyces sp. NPDC089424 TaxID=3365917 RepID=UPI0037F37432